MKRVLSIGLVMALVSVACLAADVPSVNVAGFARKGVAAGELTIVGVNLAGIGGDQTLQSLFGDDVTAGVTPGSADRIVTWDAVNQQYQAYCMYSVDGEFYPCDTLDEWNNGAATNPVLEVGEAVWFKTHPTIPNEVSVTGEAVAETTKDVPMVFGLNLVCYPLSAEITIDDTSLGSNTDAVQGTTPGSADQLITWEGSGYQRYALYTDGNWYGCNTLQEWNDESVLGSDRVLKVGEGFWYRSRNATGITWTEANPYLANL